MKLLSIAVPCYNSAAYMDRCIKSLLVGGEEVEILIVNDGSSDDTAKIAEKWQAKYPTIIRAIHQENAGHGGAVNTGMKHATGLYFKVVDSDDKVKKSAFQKILEVLRKQAKEEEPVDMVLANYVYDKQGVTHKKIINYRNVLPKDRVFTWDEVGRFKIGQYILMHSIIYRTKMLKESGLRLPKHTFYVDNIFAFYPFPYVKTLYYVDVNFYWYFIGRDDQSVNEKVMISRIDQQILVNRIMIDEFTKIDFSEKRLQRYMLNYLTMITTISSIMCIRSKDPALYQKKKDLWEYLKDTDRKLYQKIRYSLLGIGLNLPGKTGKTLASKGYEIAQKIYGFN